jgi:pimeloyl-ACP methyl ester carboxylesterase
VDGHGAATVTVPLGATSPRPIVVALQGSADRPEWQCGTWHGIARGNAFVLCPRGKPASNGLGAPERFTLGTAEETERELRAALGALKKRFGAWVASGSVVLAGFERGAALALAVMKQEPSFFSKLVLVDGGAGQLSSALAQVFAEGRGERVLLVCSTAACSSETARARLFLHRVGVHAVAVDAGRHGPSLDAVTASAIARAWPAFVAGDPRWASVAPSAPSTAPPSTTAR